MIREAQKQKRYSSTKYYIVNLDRQELLYLNDGRDFYLESNYNQYWKQDIEFLKLVIMGCYYNHAVRNYPWQSEIFLNTLINAVWKFIKNTPPEQLKIIANTSVEWDDIRHKCIRGVSRITNIFKPRYRIQDGRHRFSFPKNIIGGMKHAEKIDP